MLRRCENTEVGRELKMKWQQCKGEEDQQGDGRMWLSMIRGLEKGTAMDRET